VTYADANGVTAGVRAAIRAGSRLLGHDRVPGVKAEDVITSEELRNSRADTDAFWTLPSRDHDLPTETDCTNPFGRPLERGEFVNPLRFWYRPGFVCEVSDVRLLAPGGLGVASDGRLFEDTISFPYADHERLETFVSDTHTEYPLAAFAARFTSGRPDRHVSQSLDVACPLCGWGDNYYHWTLENLAALRAVEHYTDQTGVEPTLVIPPDPPRFIHESLSLLGVDRDSYVELDGVAVDVDTLVLPAYPEPTADNLNWLRTTVLDAVSEPAPESTPDRIYVSRDKASRRRIRNENELLEALAAFGFDRVFAEDYSVADQIRLFRGADAVVSPHGAGLTNVVWADDAAVVEIHNDHVREHFYVLANNVGLDYVPVAARSVAPAEMDSDMVVDVAEVKAALRRVGLAQH